MRFENNFRFGTIHCYFFVYKTINCYLISNTYRYREVWKQFQIRNHYWTIPLSVRRTSGIYRRKFWSWAWKNLDLCISMHWLQNDVQILDLQMFYCVHQWSTENFFQRWRFWNFDAGRDGSPEKSLGVRRGRAIRHFVSCLRNKLQGMNSPGKVVQRGGGGGGCSDTLSPLLKKLRLIFHNIF